MIGWGVDKPQLIFKSNIKVDPIKRDHLRIINRSKDQIFMSFNGSFAHQQDKKLGLNSDIFSSLNKTAQRKIVKNAGYELLKKERSQLKIIQKRRSNSTQISKQNLASDANVLPIYQLKLKRQFPKLLHLMSNPFQKPELNFNKTEFGQSWLKSQSNYHKTCSTCISNINKLIKSKKIKRIANGTLTVTRDY